MKKCAACFAALVLLVVVCASPAMAAGFELPETVSLTAAEVYLVNLDTGIVVYEKDADTPRSIASLTKMMTALLLMEQVEDVENTMITAERSLFTGAIIEEGSSTADIQPGETVRALDMLYAMMLPSANEAAEAVGYYLSGGNLNNFYAMMNARAKELGCTNTQFTSTNGLVDMDGGNYSTAHDLFLIAQECWKHEIFRTVCGTLLYWMPFTDNAKHSTAAYPEQNPDAAYFITTTNRMIQPSSGVYRSYIKGIKTGSTYAAGRNFVSAAVNDNGESFIAVVLGCPWDAAEDGYAYSFHDTAALYDWVFDNFSVRPALETDVPITEVKVNYSADVSSLKLYPASDMKTILPNDSGDLMEYSFDVPADGVDAPLSQGDKVGTLTLSLSGQVIGTVDLVAGQDVSRSLFLYGLALVKSALTSTYVKVVAVLTVLFFTGYGLLFWYVNKKEAERRARRRDQRGPRKP